MELYWLLRLPHLHLLFAIGSGVSFFISVFLIFGGIAEEAWVVAKVGFFIMGFSFICAILACLCPDKTDLAIMLGWDAIRSDSVQQVIEILKDKIK